MSKKIFKDPKLQERFETEGYVKIPFLHRADVRQLQEMFFQYFPEPAEGFFSSSYLNDFDLKKEISNKIVEVMNPRFERYFTNYRCFGSAFLSKTAGNRSEMPMHQDWSIVNEDEFVAVNIWTPLSDADKTNGSLEVLPGSHSFAKVRRSPTLPFFWEGYEGEMQKGLYPLQVLAGEAVVLNQATVHYSPANKTPEVRPAITTGLLSAGAKMEFNYQTAPGEVDIYQMEDDFLLQWENFHEAIFKRPTFGEVVRQEQYAHPKVPREEFLSYLTGLQEGAKNAQIAAIANYMDMHGMVPGASTTATRPPIPQANQTPPPRPEKVGFFERLKRMFG